MRVVRGPEDLVGAEVLRGERQGDLVGIEADHALPREQLAGQRALVRAAEDPELVIEPLEHRHDPSTGALQEGHPQLRVPFADAAEHEEADGHLEVERVRQALLQREPRHDVGHAIGETQQAGMSSPCRGAARDGCRSGNPAPPPRARTGRSPDGSASSCRGTTAGRSMIALKPSCSTHRRISTTAASRSWSGTIPTP